MNKEIFHNSQKMKDKYDKYNIADIKSINHGMKKEYLRTPLILSQHFEAQTKLLQKLVGSCKITKLLRVFN